MLSREKGGCAAAEVDGFFGDLVGALVEFELAQDGVDEATCVGVAGQVFVEAAVGADSVAEGDVNVEVVYF